MNKLISRNPVQRFKQGRKIVKAQFGWHVREDGVVVNSAGVPVGRYGSGYRPYSMTQDASYQAEWPNDRQIASGLYLEPGTNNVYASGAEEDGGPIGNLISKGPEPPANGTYYETTNASGKVVDRGRYFGGKKQSLPIGGTQRKRAYYQRSADGSLYLIGTDGSKTLISKGNKSANSSRTQVTNVSNRARQRNPGAYHNITTWQNKLKDFYEPGTFAADGMWGKNTEAAYQKYLLDQSNKKVIADLPNTLPVIKSFSPTPTINPNQTLNIQAPQQTFNRAQVRDFIRSKGFGAYDFTGDQRKALRMVLNGQGTDADKALVQSMGIFKKGGQLPSRNIVTRFKMRVKQ